MEKWLIGEIEEAIQKADDKHGEIPDDIYHQVTILTEELGEVAMASLDGDLDGYREELFDLIAPCIRILLTLPRPE